MRLRIVVGLAAMVLAGCASPPKEKLTVAAAANLTTVFDEVGQAFTAKSGIEVVFTYASTAQLEKQIENGAPFDIFAAADVEHIDTLVAANKAQDRAVYALGQLALWSPKLPIAAMNDLLKPDVRFVAIAQPELAPYGQASVDALQAAGLWDPLKPKIVYGGSISQAKQLASSGNADAAFTAYSLVMKEKGTVLKIETARKIEQALAVIKRSTSAGQFRAFVLGPEGRAILARGGYLLPPTS